MTKVIKRYKMILGDSDKLKINGVAANEISYVFKQHNGRIVVHGYWHKELMFLITGKYDKLIVESESIGVIDDVCIHILKIDSQMEDGVRYKLKLDSISRIPV